LLTLTWSGLKSSQLESYKVSWNLSNVKDGIRRTEVKDNRQKLLFVPEKCTTSERNVLSDDRKKTPMRS